MANPALRIDLDEDAAEAEALGAAVEEARKDRTGVDHSEMREWLLKVAAGEFDAPPPEAKPLRR